MLVTVSCQHRMTFLPLLTIASAIFVLAGGYLSWPLWCSFAGQVRSGPAETRHFFAGLSLLSTGLFVFAILLQGAATLFLECER